MGVARDGSRPRRASASFCVPAISSRVSKLNPMVRRYTGTWGPAAHGLLNAMDRRQLCPSTILENVKEIFHVTHSRSPTRRQDLIRPPFSALQDPYGHSTMAGGYGRFVEDVKRQRSRSRTATPMDSGQCSSFETVMFMKDGVAVLQTGATVWSARARRTICQ